jgi:hypothetical protein
LAGPRGDKLATFGGQTRLAGGQGRHRTGGVGERIDVQQAHQERLAVASLAVVEQLVDEALAASAAVDEHVPSRRRMYPHLLVAPVPAASDG